MKRTKIILGVGLIAISVIMTIGCENVKATDSKPNTLTQMSVSELEDAIDKLWSNYKVENYKSPEQALRVLSEIQVLQKQYESLTD